jgi:hypothetical protein
VKYVKQTPKRLQKFKECVAIEKINSKVLLCLDVSTRWNSTYLMLDTTQKFEKTFETYAEQDQDFLVDLVNGGEKEGGGKSFGAPSVSDWRNIEKKYSFF